MDGALHQRESFRLCRKGEEESAAETAAIVAPLLSCSSYTSLLARAKKTNNKKQDKGLPADIECQQTSSMLSMSDYSKKEEIARLKRKIANQNQIIKKHKQESMQNKKSAMSTKKEYEMTLNIYY